MFNHFFYLFTDFLISNQEHPEITCIDIDKLDDNFELLSLLALFMCNRIKY